MFNNQKSQIKAKILVVENSQKRSHLDTIATEEPLEIRLVNPFQTVAVTMRTPGADFDLAAGFLYSEAIITSKKDLNSISYCVEPNIDGEQRYNIINVNLKEGLQPNLKPLERHFFTSSACGVCGKASIEALKLRGCSPISNHLTITPEIIYSLPEKLRAAQGIFTATGGLHAAALFDKQGNLIKLREDVGRHNALDKLIGSAFLSDEIPLNNKIIMVSGRSSFEIVQKCIMARVPILCAVSAPSSLAVSLSQQFGITLIGFLRGQKFNIYSGTQRIIDVTFN
ncbi:MAG TPA: formate dehydrogenase accessory sulfurtransferase FdhD [Cyanothece sp. UBA12306]|nr:formate dehydrogenase accessory sulfurtransferase FdhD [Cyanothece sp. UBA12306]